MPFTIMQKFCQRTNLRSRVATTACCYDTTSLIPYQTKRQYNENPSWPCSIMVLMVLSLFPNIVSRRCPCISHPGCRTDVSNCTTCVGVEGCGYCLSTLQCMDGTPLGPSDGSPCPSWITDTETCPGERSIAHGY